MKSIFFDSNNKKLFEIQHQPYEKLEDKYIVKDIPQINPLTKTVLDNINNEVYLYLPYNNGEDFYLQYHNGIYSYSNSENHYVKGGLISKILEKEDPNKHILNELKKAYNTGETEYYIYFINDDNEILKILHSKVIRNDETVFSVHKDVTEIFTYRDNLLNDEVTGVAFYQDGKFIEVNDKFLKNVRKERNEVIGEDFKYEEMTESSVKNLKQLIHDIFTYKVSNDKIITESYENNKIKYYVNNEISLMFYNNKPALLIKNTDLTKQERIRILNNKAVLLNQKFDAFQTVVDEYLTYKERGKPTIWTDTLYYVLDDDNRIYDCNKNELRDIVIDEDKPLLDKKLEELSPENPETMLIVRIKTLKNNIKYLKVFIKVDFDENGEIVRYVTSNHNVTTEFNNIQKIKDDIIAKNAEIEEKNNIIKDIHHRVKTNLQLILSLIDLDEHFNSDNLMKLLEDTKGYVNAIAIMHQQIYKSESLDSINLKNYTDALTKSLLKMYASEINYVSNIDSYITLNINQAIPLSLILNELISNTINYAFPDEKESATINVDITEDDNIIYAEFKDNGIGLPSSVNLNNIETIGLIVVESLIDQLNGEISFKNNDGLQINIKFNKE